MSLAKQLQMPHLQKAYPILSLNQNRKNYRSLKLSIKLKHQLWLDGSSYVSYLLVSKFYLEHCKLLFWLFQQMIYLLLTMYLQ